jgi:hypothetical protein
MLGACKDDDEYEGSVHGADQRPYVWSVVNRVLDKANVPITHGAVSAVYQSVYKMFKGKSAGSEVYQAAKECVCSGVCRRRNDPGNGFRRH